MYKILYIVNFKGMSFKMKRILNIGKVIIILLVYIVILAFLTRLLEPKYATDIVEGSFIEEYYEEEKNHEVILIGDCEIYSNFSPLEMYEKQGITSYVRATPQQLIWQSYSILDETLTYETPKVVVLSVNCMKYDKPVSEAYNRLTIDRMKWSKQKIEIIQSSMTEEESFLSYIFPLLRYHSRWEQLTEEDFNYIFKNKNNTYEGYLMKKEIKPVETLPVKRNLTNYQFSDICYKYLDKITQLCKQKGIKLILVKAPSVYPYWYDEYDKQIEEYAEKNEIKYINFLDNIEEIGIDFSKDTYDSGMHLNLTGARKLSAYFANILKNEYQLTDFRQNDKINGIYEQKLQKYYKEIL